MSERQSGRGHRAPNSVAGSVPACCGCGETRRAVRGVDWHPFIAGVGDGARLAAWDDPPAVDVVEQAGRSEEQTSARALHDLQSADVPPVSPVGESRAEGRGDPQVGQEPVGTTLPSAEVRERES